MTNPIAFFAQRLGGVVLVLAAAGPGAAQSALQSTPSDASRATVEYCVRCVAPQATNVCSISVENGVVSVSEWQAFCGAQVAYDGGYGQCSATPGVQACPAAQVFSYRSTPEQGIVAVDSAPGQPGARSGGVFEGAADYMRQTVDDGAEVVSETAGEVRRGVVRGAGEVGDSIVRGLGCVFTLGRQC